MKINNRIKNDIICYIKKLKFEFIKYRIIKKEYAVFFYVVILRKYYICRYCELSNL